MNIKMTINSQISTEPKKKQTKQTTGTGTESSIWRLSAGREKGENGEKGTGVKKHNWQVQNRQGSVKNSIGNVEAKELICTTHDMK